MNTFEENVNQDLRNGISIFFELMLLVTILVSKIGEENGLTGLYGGSRKVQCKRTYATIFFSQVRYKIKIKSAIQTAKTIHSHLLCIVKKPLI